MKKIGELLVESQVISPADLEKALTLQSQPGEKRKIGEILIDMDLLTMDSLLICLNMQLAD